MSRSSIERLDPRIREAIDRAIREDRATIDDLVELIDRMGGEASRSAVGRYAKHARDQLAEYVEAQRTARVWVDALGKEPEGDVGRLLVQMLQGIAQRHLVATDQIDTKEFATLARALKDLSMAQRTSTEVSFRIREEVAKEAAEKASKVAEAAVKTGGMSRQAADEIRSAILGIARSS